MAEREQNFSFNTWSDFIAHAETAHSDMSIDDRASRGTDRDDWNGTKDYAEAASMARKGWPEGVAKAQSIAQPIEQRLYNIIDLPTISYDVTGELLDVGRYCTGEPDHWGNWDKQLTEGEGTRYIHIVVNGTASGATPAETLIARGATASALITLLEIAGHRVKVTLGYCTKIRDYRSEVTVTLKQYDEPLDLDRLTYALAHPSTFRRHCFSVWETMRAEMRSGLNIGRGYGMCADTDKRGDIYLGHMSSDESQWMHPDRAVAWTLKQLQSLGVIKETQEV